MAATEDLTYAVRTLATALDSIGARIYRDVNPDSSYQPFDEQTGKLLGDFTAYAEEQLAALDDPAVRRAMSAAGMPGNAR